jgi:hypothetical protein
MAVTGFAMLAGHWNNSITEDDYAKRFQEIESPLYQH